MILKYDLHSHSNFSDGKLTPTQLFQRAKNQQVTALALTDHDTTAGLLEAQTIAKSLNMQCINGIEISTTWEKKCLHILGLGINPQAPALVEGIAGLQSLRHERARKIALKLAKQKITGAYEQVVKNAGSSMITRCHFANFLLDAGHVPSFQKAFDNYLAQGKSAFVATEWVEMATAINWIQQAGGIPVLAHPLRYKLTASWMRKLLTAFKQAGGLGIEVVTGNNNAHEIHTSYEYAKKFALAASVGSDFHDPNNKWIELGRLAPLPTDIPAVWNLLSVAE